MRILLLILAFFVFLAGFAIFSQAKSAIHEIEAFILFLITAVFVSGASVVDAINRLRNDMRNQKSNCK